MINLKRKMTICAMIIFSAAFVSIAATAIPAGAEPTEDKPSAAQAIEAYAGPIAAKLKAGPQPERYVYYDVPLTDDLQEYIQELCAEYEFPRYDIIVAMIQQESGFQPWALSETGDYGLMQINQCNHPWLRRELGVTDIMDERQNILCGVYIIQQLYHKYDDIGLALMAYNCGETGAGRLLAQGTYSTSYSRSIEFAASQLAERSA